MEISGFHRINALVALGRRQETGRSAVELFADSGLDFVKSSNERVAGWLALHELLQPRKDTDGAVRPRLTIFDTCHNLIRTLPALQHDKRNPSDTANTPHELTHAPDAIRYFCSGRPYAGQPPVTKYKLPPELRQTEEPGGYQVW